MSGKGYIKLYRQIQDCWIWFADEKFSKAQAWVDLLMLANHSDKKFYFNGEVVNIKRGQNLTSIRALSERWGWSKDSVSRFLKLLENDGMIEKTSDTHRTLITVMNYEVFQSSETDGETQIGQEQGHTQGHDTDTNKDTGETQIGTNNKLNNDNKNVEECINNDNKNVEEYIIPPIIPPKGNKPPKQTSAELRNIFIKLTKESELSEPLKNKVIEWLEYKSQIKNQYKSPDGFSKLLSQIAKNALEYTDVEVMRVMDETMAAGYKGIVWDWLSKKQMGGKTYVDAVTHRLDVVDEWLREEEDG